MTRSIIFLISILYASCNASNKSNQEVDEIATLQTTEQQKVFLENIYHLDQDVRHHATEQQTKFGYNSEEHLQAMGKFMETDLLNVHQIEVYLKKYGHPSIEAHGMDAVLAPWIVLHHIGDGNVERRRNFKYLYSAYKNNDLDDGRLTFFLNRMYDFEFGYRINWGRPFTSEEELDTLFKALDLVSIVNEVDDSLARKVNFNQ